MQKSSNRFKLPRGSNWVLWHLKVAIKSALRQTGTWIPAIRLALLFTAVPLWYLAASLNIFWLVVLAFSSWYVGWALNENKLRVSFPEESYVKSVMWAVFWVTVLRMLLLAFSFFLLAIGG